MALSQNLFRVQISEEIIKASKSLKDPINDAFILHV